MPYFNNGKYKQSEWLCVEKINNYTYTLQSTGLTTGVWPSYAIYRNAKDNVPCVNMDLSQITPYSSSARNYFDKSKELKSFYDTWNSAEANGGYVLKSSSYIWQTGESAQNGLYIPSGSKLTTTPSLYKLAMSLAAQLTGKCWRGDYPSTNATRVQVIMYDGSTYQYEDQDQIHSIAPCFNLDVSKIRINTAGNIIVKK